MPRRVRPRRSSKARTACAGVRCTRGKRREIEWPEPLGDLAEAVEVAGVAAEIEAPGRSHDGPGGPEPRIGVPEATLGEVLRRRAHNPEPAVLEGLPPVELHHARQALAAEPGLEAERDHEERIVGGPEPLHGVEIQVIEMVVRDDHEVNRRQVLEREARRLEPPRPRPRDRARARAPVRIREQVDPVELQQDRRVPDPRHRRLGPVRAQRGPVIGFPRDIAAPGRLPGPAPDVGEAGAGGWTLEGRIGVAEAALDVVSRPAGDRLRADTRACGREQHEQDQPGPRSHGVRVYPGTRRRATALRPAWLRFRWAARAARAPRASAACAACCG